MIGLSMLASNPIARQVTARFAIVPSRDSPLDRCRAVRLTSLVAAAPHLACNSGRERAKGVYLLPSVLSLLLADSGDRSRKLPGSGIEDGIAKGVGQHWQRRLSHRKGTGCILEMAGSSGDLKRQDTMRLSNREIYAIASLCEIEVQQTAVVEANHAPTDRFREMEEIGTRACAGRRRRIGQRSYVADGE